MKNNYGKLTKKKVLSIINTYDETIRYLSMKVLDIEIYKSDGECDCAQVIIKYAGLLGKYFISSYGITFTSLEDGECDMITEKNIFLESEE